MKVYIRKGHDAKCFMPTLQQKIKVKIEQFIGMALQPNIIGEVNSNVLYKKAKELGAQNVLLADEKYKLTDVASMKRFLELDDTDKPKYVPIWFDCDDFSFRLMGQFHTGKWASLAFGIAWSNTHAFNIFFDGNKFWIIEPQTDQIIDAASASGAYKPIELIMM